MAKDDGVDPEENKAQRLAQAARALARAIETGINIHERRLHPEADEGSSWAPIPPRVVAEIVAWMGAQYCDTGVWDVEAAAARFEVPAEILWPELARYFRSRANGGWRGGWRG